MLTTPMKMPEMVAVIVERMYRTMMADPQYLLMQDGGPVGRTAHVVIARLYGADEQLDHEWRLDKAAPVLLTPHLHRPSALLTSDLLPREHEYVLQSLFAVGGLSASAADSETLRWIGVDPNPQSFDWDFLGLRYHRR